MVNGLFFCATLPGRREGHTPLCKQEQERLITECRWLSRTHTILERVIPGGWVPVSEMKVWSLIVLSNHSLVYVTTVAYN